MSNGVLEIRDAVIFSTTANIAPITISGGTLSLINCKIQGNNTAGVCISQSGGTIYLKDCLLINPVAGAANDCIANTSTAASTPLIMIGTNRFVSTTGNWMQNTNAINVKNIGSAWARVAAAGGVITYTVGAAPTIDTDVE